MLRSDIPFNIDLLQLTPQKLKGVSRVTALDSMEGSSREFHPAGLFSVEIFGKVGDEKRSRRFAYIDLKIEVFHPLVYRTLIKLKSLYAGIMNGTEYAIWNNDIKDFIRAAPLEGGETGYYFFLKHWKNIDFGDDSEGQRRLKVDFINKVKDYALTSEVIVMPAGLREMELDEFGRIQEDEINPLYRRLISYSNTITFASAQHNPQILDNPRAQLQLAFVAVYDAIENLVKGKKKLLLGKWLTRRIFNGTRNVITAMDPTVEYLGAPGNVTYNSTIIGLYQYMKGSLPMTIHDIRKTIEPFIFDASRPASLVDKKTLTRVDVSLSAKTYNQWLTNEGIEKIITAYKETSIRAKLLEIEGYYLALLYRGLDGTFKVFQDIRDLPDASMRNSVTPITVTEFLYWCVYRTAPRLAVLTTRYPVTGIGSIYPSKIHLRVTTKFQKRKELGDNWQPLDDSHIAYEFPEGDVYVNSQVLPPSRLVSLGADHDGDTTSANIVYSDEATKEIEDILQSPQAYISPTGTFIDSSGTATVNMVLFNMTGDPQ